MPYMKKGPNDKGSNADSRGSDGEGLGMDAVAKANAINFEEPEDGGGEQGAPAKNHWDGSGAKENKVPASNGGLGVGGQGGM